MPKARLRPLRSSLATLGLGLGLVVGLGMSGCDKEPKTKSESPTEQAKADGAKAEPAEPKSAEGTPQAKGDDGASDKVKVVDGAAPGDERYALQIEPPAEASAGQEGEVVVRVVPKEPWHMNLDFPTSLEVQPPSGVTLAKAKLSKADAELDDAHCEFAVKFTPSEAGAQDFTGKLKFAVCQDEACSPVTEEVKFQVAVK